MPESIPLGTSAINPSTTSVQERWCVRQRSRHDGRSEEKEMVAMGAREWEISFIVGSVAMRLDRTRLTAEIHTDY